MSSLPRRFRKREVSGVADKTPARPKNVVIVDADNPLVEVHGEFFWREDHDAIVSAAREEAYRRGYADGWNETTRNAPAGQLVVRRRPPRLTRLIRRGVVAVLVLAFVAAVLLSVLDAVIART
jgi:hypothetical protein